MFFYLLALLISSASADAIPEAPPPVPHMWSVEILGGGLTYHFVANSPSRFSNKISSDGRLISNLTYGLGVAYTDFVNSFYIAVHLFQGNNSVNQPINGGTLSIDAITKYCDVGFVVGAYVQNDYDFISAGIAPFSITSGANAIVPIIGLEINPKFAFGDRYYVKLNNIITPIITNHSLSLGMYF